MDQIFSTKKGKGHPVIFIHGFCETHQIWNQLSDYLSSNYTVYSIDLPGFGESALPVTPFSIADIANLVLNWLNENKIERPVIIGHSLGGYVVLAMASKNPSLFTGLGLFHSTPEADTPEKKENRNKTIDFVSRNGVQAYINNFVPALFYKKDNPFIDFIHKIASSTKKETIIHYLEAMRDRPGYLNLLKNLEIPILYIGGTHDTFVNLQNLRIQAKLSPFSHYFELQNTGHMGMFETEPESNFILENFLRNCF